MIERGEKSISLDTLIALSKVLHVSTDYLLFGAFFENCSDPVNDMLKGLTPTQREDAAHILRLYAKACSV